jgi:hypothetical protein
LAVATQKVLVQTPPEFEQPSPGAPDKSRFFMIQKQLPAEEPPKIAMINASTK